jgi:iron complex transport system permease protein
MMRRAWFMLAMMAALLLLAVAARLLVGDAQQGLRWPESPAVWELRAGRVWAAGAVGVALAVGGVFLQSLLRNPLASPDLIGPGAGAGLGVMIAVYAGHAAGAGSLSTASLAGPALIGSLGALALVYTLAQRRGLVEPVSLVLVGVMTSITCGAITMLISRLLPPDAARVGSVWMFGSISDDVPGPVLWVVSAVAVAATAYGAFSGPAMDAMAMSEDEARSVGVPVGRMRLALFALAGILAAAAVVIAGPIGFVGLVCPHLFRLLAGPSHRALVLGAALAGAALVIGADAAVKAWPTESGRLPVGVLTTLIGGPVFLALLRRDGARP